MASSIENKLIRWTCYICHQHPKEYSVPSIESQESSKKTHIFVDDPMIKHHAYTAIAQQAKIQPVHDASQQPSNLMSCSSDGETAPISQVVSDPSTASLIAPDDCGLEDSASCSSGKSTPLPQDEDSNSMERWGKEATLLIIEEYQNRACQVDRGKKTKKALWQEIAGCLKGKGYAYNADQVAGRRKSLVRAYKNVKDNNKKSGSSRKTFPYESRLDEIFANDPSITPVYVSSSRNSKVHMDEDETSSNESSATCETSSKEKSRKRKSQGGEMLEVMKLFIEHQDERKKEEKEQRERFHREKIDAILSIVNVIKGQK